MTVPIKQIVPLLDNLLFALSRGVLRLASNRNVTLVLPTKAVVMFVYSQNKQGASEQLRSQSNIISSDAFSSLPRLPDITLEKSTPTPAPTLLIT